MFSPPRHADQIACQTKFLIPLAADISSPCTNNPLRVESLDRGYANRIRKTPVSVHVVPQPCWHICIDQLPSSDFHLLAVELACRIGGGAGSGGKHRLTGGLAPAASRWSG